MTMTNESATDYDECIESNQGVKHKKHILTDAS